MPRRKAPALRQGRGTSDLSLVAGQGRETPAVSSGWLAATKRRWAELWTSELAAFWVDTDVGGLRRLHDLYDERERLRRVVAKVGLFAEGSTGQIVAHPALREVASLDKRIESLEDRFGLSPKARLALGVQLGAAAASLDALNKLATNSTDHDVDDDPRLRVIDVNEADR